MKNRSRKSLTMMAMTLAAGAALLAPVVPAQAVPAAPAATAVVAEAPAVFTTAAVKKDSHTKAGAVAAAKRWFKYWNVEDWEAQYNRLVPEQQDLVSMDEFTEWRDSDFYPYVKWVKTVRTSKFSADLIAGTDLTRSGIKVTARIRVAGQTTTIPMHWYYVNSRWRWSLTQDSLDEIMGSTE